MATANNNKEIRRYYLYNFIINAVDTGSGNFTIVYFFFHGFTVVDVLAAIITYGLTCLIILKPIGFLIERVGPQKTFRLHLIAEALKYSALLLLILSPAAPAARLPLFLLWQCFNGFNVMLSRVPLTAYFSVYGDPGKRGAQIGLANNIQLATSVLMPLIAGALIQHSGLILISTITVIGNVAATFVLKFDERISVANPVRFARLHTHMPRHFSRSFFIAKTVYPLSADLLSIYIAIALHSFTVLGLFIGLRTAIAIFLNYRVGRMADAQTVRTLFCFSILLSSAFWLVLPFAQGATAIFILQFTLGLAGFITSIPFERAYHNAAQSSGHSVHFAIWREVVVQSGLVLGSSVILILLRLHLINDWRTLLPLGAISALALLFVLPYIANTSTRSYASNTVSATPTA